jgi:hypothetical protein
MGLRAIAGVAARAACGGFGRLFGCLGCFQCLAALFTRRALHHIDNKANGQEAIADECKYRAQDAAIHVRGFCGSHHDGNVKPSDYDDVHAFRVFFN